MGGKQRGVGQGERVCCREPEEEGDEAGNADGDDDGSRQGRWPHARWDYDAIEDADDCKKDEGMSQPDEGWGMWGEEENVLDCDMHGDDGSQPGAAGDGGAVLCNGDGQVDRNRGEEDEGDPRREDEGAAQGGRPQQEGGTVTQGNEGGNGEDAVSDPEATPSTICGTPESWKVARAGGQGEEIGTQAEGAQVDSDGCRGREGEQGEHVNGSAGCGGGGETPGKEGRGGGGSMREGTRGGVVRTRPSGPAWTIARR